MKSIPVLMVMLFISGTAMAQKIYQPNYGLKSPSTAEISWVDYRSDCTEVCILIRNEVEGGFFCIERNTKLIKPDGTTVFLKEIRGLKFCPELYKFKAVGESVTVTLIFPATGYMDWFSLIEDCTGGCLTFRGVVTNAELNEDLEAAYDAAFSGQYKDAVDNYRSIIEKYDTGAEGAVYANLIMLLKRNGEENLAKSWYEKMVSSVVPDKELYLENLRQRGVSY